MKSDKNEKNPTLNDRIKPSKRSRIIWMNLIKIHENAHILPYNTSTRKFLMNELFLWIG